MRGVLAQWPKARVFGWDRVVKIWDVGTGHVLASLVGHGGVVTSIAFAPDGVTLVSSSLDRAVKVWRCGQRNQVGTLRVQSSNDVRAAGPFNPRETPPPRDTSADDTKTSPPPISSGPTPMVRLPVVPPPTTPKLPCRAPSPGNTDTVPGAQAIGCWDGEGLIVLGVAEGGKAGNPRCFRRRHNRQLWSCWWYTG